MFIHHINYSIHIILCQLTILSFMSLCKVIQPISIIIDNVVGHFWQVPICVFCVFHVVNFSQTLLCKYTIEFSVNQISLNFRKQGGPKPPSPI